VAPPVLRKALFGCSVFRPWACRRRLRGERSRIGCSFYRLTTSRVARCMHILRAARSGKVHSFWAIYASSAKPWRAWSTQTLLD